MKIINKIKYNQACIIGVVRGLAFAIITGGYTLIGGELSKNLWVVYLGFLLTMALNASKSKYFDYVLSHSIGYAYSLLLYFLVQFFGSFFTHFISAMISDFLITFIVLFLHLSILSYTKFNQIPMIFASIAVIASSGSFDKIVYCAPSMFLGISTAIITGVIIDKWIMFQKITSVKK